MKSDPWLQGVIDLHVHASPDIRPRLLDCIEAATLAKEAGMRAIVLKNHVIPTVDQAALASQVVRGIDVFGGIVLNREVGGFNTHAVRAAFTLGAKIVWMPTTSSVLDSQAEGRRKGLSIVADGRSLDLIPEVEEILDLIAENNGILATGHLGAQETELLLEASVRKGIKKFLVNHPEEKSLGISLELRKRLVEGGAFLEYCFNYCTPRKMQLSIKEYAEVIRATGPDRLVLATDLGQLDNFSPIEGFRVFIRSLLSLGIPEGWIRRMTVDNPAYLLYG